MYIKYTWNDKETIDTLNMKISKTANEMTIEHVIENQHDHIYQ